MRSRLLLPADGPEIRAAETEAGALRRPLVDRARMRAAANWPEHRPNSSGNSRGAEDRTDVSRRRHHRLAARLPGRAYEVDDLRDKEGRHIRTDQPAQSSGARLRG